MVGGQKLSNLSVQERTLRCFINQSQLPSCINDSLYILSGRDPGQPVDYRFNRQFLVGKTPSDGSRV